MSTRPVFPSKNIELPGIVLQKVDVWEDAPPADIGLDVARVTALKDANSAAQVALTDLIAKKAAAENATAVFNTACKTVRQLGGQCVRSIDAFALASVKPAEVWELAGIPAPKTPGTGPGPAQPFGLLATLNNLGELTLTWKCSNPRGVTGVIYQVLRGLNGAVPTAYDVIGEKRFVDGNVPMGTQSVTYIVRGKHGQRTGLPSSDFVIRFGTGGGGMVIASQGETTQTTKLAA